MHDFSIVREAYKWEERRNQSILCRRKTEQVVAWTTGLLSLELQFKQQHLAAISELWFQTAANSGINFMFKHLDAMKQVSPPQNYAAKRLENISTQGLSSIPLLIQLCTVPAEGMNNLMSFLSFAPWKQSGLPGVGTEGIYESLICAWAQRTDQEQYTGNT